MFMTQFFRVAGLVGLLFLSLNSVQNGMGQEPKTAAPSAAKPRASQEGATLRGQLTVAEKLTEWVKPDELKLVLAEHVGMAEPPLPEGWNEMAPEKQVEWWTGFQQSEAGKKFIAEQEKRFAKRKLIDVVVEPDGTFTVYDVSPGVWDLRGAVTKQTDRSEVLFEVFGELTVQEDVDELALGKMPVQATPLFKAGDEFPALSARIDDDQPVDLKAFRGKYFLLTFWNAADPGSAAFQKNLFDALQKVTAKHPVELISVGLNQDTEALKKFSEENGTQGILASARWEDAVVDDFGVRGIPWLALVGPDGKIALSDREMGFALRTSGLELADVIVYKIEGKEIPKPEPPAAADEGQAGKDK